MVTRVNDGQNGNSDDISGNNGQKLKTLRVNRPQHDVYKLDTLYSVQDAVIAEN